MSTVAREPSSPHRAPPGRLVSVGHIGVAVGFGIAAAVLLSPLFITPFPVIVARTLFLAGWLLAVYVAAERWPERWRPRWLPRWLVTTTAVALAAPLGAFAIYAVTLGGDLERLFDSRPHLSGLHILGGTALVLGLVTTLAALLREREARSRALQLQFELERSQLERQAADARLALLQAQIEPHFLFNTLANVQALVETGSPRAAPTLQSLIDYLRAAMPRLQDGEPTLGNELALVRAYLELMQMRMPDRLQWRLDADAALAARPFPPLLLMTLVENAVQHGIDPGETGGRIDVGVAAAADGGLRLWVADTGVGLAHPAPDGIGLGNVRERLRMRYGPAATLTLGANAPRGVRAEIVIPAAAATA